MKTKTIETPSCTLLVTELPVGAHKVYINTSHDREVYTEFNVIDYDIKGELGTKTFKPPFDWVELINRLPEVTEEQAIEIVESIHLTIMGTWYKSYKDHTWTCELATTSLRTMIESEGIHFENPLGEPPLPTCTSNGIDVDRYTKIVQDWQTAQEQVWDKQRTYIFKQVKL